MLNLLEEVILTQFVNDVAKRDRSAPPNWLTFDLIGMKGLEHFVVHTEKDPMAMARICDEALDGVTDSAARLALELGALTGYRKSDKPDDMAEAARRFEGTSQGIAGLPDGLHRVCLQTSWNYQSSIFMRKQGQYEAAARAHAALACDPAVSVEDQSVSRFLEVQCILWRLLERGDSQEITEGLDLLRRAFRILQVALKGNAKHEANWRINGAMHLMQAMLFAGVSHGDDWTELMAIFNSGVKDHGPRNKEWAKLFAAVGDFAALQELANSQTHGDVTATAYFLMGRMMEVAGDIPSAIVYYHKVPVAPEGHVVVSMAANRIQSFGD